MLFVKHSWTWNLFWHHCHQSPIELHWRPNVSTLLSSVFTRFRVIWCGNAVPYILKGWCHSQRWWKYSYDSKISTLLATDVKFKMVLLMLKNSVVGYRWCRFEFMADIRYGHGCITIFNLTIKREPVVHFRKRFDIPRYQWEMSQTWVIPNRICKRHNQVW